MPHLSSNIPSTISSGSIFSELLRMARYSLRTKNCTHRVSDLFPRMIVQDGNRAALTKQKKRSFIVTQMFFKNLVKLMRK